MGPTVYNTLLSLDPDPYMQTEVGGVTGKVPSGDVQRGAGETGSASSQVLSAAQSLSGDSNRLQAEVQKFVQLVRSA